MTVTQVFHRHSLNSAVFPLLEGVTAELLDTVMAGFSHDDWDRLEDGLLSPVRGLVDDILGDVLRFVCEEQHDDLLVIFWRLYRAYDATYPAEQQTAQEV